MNRELITDKEAICVTTSFIMGSSLIIGVGGMATNSAWLSALIAIVCSVPVLLMYSRISSLFLGKNMFEILEILFGKILGKLVALLYIWYALDLGALVIRNFGEFVNTLTMPETPMMAILFLFGIVCIVAVRLGIEVIGRTIAYLFPLLILILVIVNILAIPVFEYNNLKPIIPDDIKPLLRGAFSAFSFPLAETVLFVCAYSSLTNKKSARKVYLYSLFIAGFIIIVLTIRNILIIGPMLENVYFPSYKAVSRIRVGDFLQRIEITVTFVFAVCAFVKTSICLLASCRGIAKIFNIRDYRSIVIQTGLIMIYFSYIIFENTMDMKNWGIYVYPFYALPFQVIIPMIIWIFAEIKCRKMNAKAKETP